MERIHYLFHGRVQGVGFRITLYQQAIKYHITGWVKNLSNGDVEACLQGNKENIDKAIAYMQSIRYIKIENMYQENLDVLESEKSFEMKY